MRKNCLFKLIPIAGAFLSLFLFSAKPTLAVQCEYIPKDSGGALLYADGITQFEPWLQELSSEDCLNKCTELTRWCRDSNRPENCDAASLECGEVTSPTLTVTCKFTPKNLRGGVIDSYGISAREVLSTSESACQKMCDDLLARCMAIDIAGSPLCSDSETTCEKISSSASSSSDTSTAPTPQTFESVTPRLEIPLPTLPSFSKFTDLTLQGEAPNRYLWVPWIGQYIAAIYKYAIGIVGILAGIMIVIGGLLWLTAGGAADRVSTAKSFIESSLVGLVIALTSYLLLYAINPNLVGFESLKVKYIEQVDWPTVVEAGIGYSDPTAEQEEESIASPAVASGDTERGQLLSVCKPKNSGVTKEKLLEILPTWVDIGKRGGATYIRGGSTQRTGCSSNPQLEFATNALSAQGISYPEGASSEILKQLYQTEIVDKVYAAGKLCGDCVTWTQQLLECAGMDYHIRLPRLKGGRTGTETGGSQTATRIATSDESCGDAASKIPGGLQFGDFFHKSSPGHMVMYVGGAGLPYEIIEMGGARSPSCELVTGLTEKLSCVRTTATKESWRSWNSVTDFCDIFRITPF